MNQPDFIDRELTRLRKELQDAGAWRSSPLTRRLRAEIRRLERLQETGARVETLRDKRLT